MVIPTIPWWLAFAIGLPLGILGYFGQAYLVGRRSRRAAEVAGGSTPDPAPDSARAVESKPGTAWGPTRDTGASATTGEEATATVVAGSVGSSPEDAAAAAPVEPETPAAVTPVRGRRTRYGGAGQAAKPAAARVPTAPPTGSIPGTPAAATLAPVDKAALSQRRRVSAALTQLRKREAYIEDALDVIVAFVDGDARRPRARSAAKALAAAVPKTRRSAEFKAFLDGVETTRAVADLQDQAEEIGLQLAVELKQVKTEILSISE